MTCLTTFFRFILTIPSLLEIVTKMGGHIWVNNNCKESDADGGGATFSFCFPRGDPIHNENDCVVGATHVNASIVASPHSNMLRVLLVDDSCKSCIGVRSPYILDERLV